MRRRGRNLTKRIERIGGDGIAGGQHQRIPQRELKVLFRRLDEPYALL